MMDVQYYYDGNKNSAGAPIKRVLKEFLVGYGEVHVSNFRAQGLQRLGFQWTYN